jgi:cytochrome-b5 reductase
LKDRTPPIAAATVQPSKPVLTNPEEWIDFKLSKITPINHNTKLLTFSLPDPEGTLGLVVNSCILTKYKGPNDEKPVVRPYTPLSDVDEKVDQDLSVIDGRASSN